jgi:DUF4097 and DUF4098 domain-containing protein YvlB
MKLSLTLMACLLAALPASAQKGSLACNDRNNNNGRNSQVSHCEMREQTVGFAGRLSIDGGANGGVSVKGWDQAGVLVRAKVEGYGPDEVTAQSMVSQVHVDMSAGQIGASGPSQSGNHQGWSVSYEVFVPRNGDISAKTVNGGISIADVRGHIEFSAVNGGVSLNRLAGDVEGKTVNGGLNVTLTGDRWDGTKFDARTMNGGVNVTMPEHYSAHLETATDNGHLNIGLPITVQGELGKRLSTNLGSGGATIHVETTNGGVNIKKATM